MLLLFLWWYLIISVDFLPFSFSSSDWIISVDLYSSSVILLSVCSSQLLKLDWILHCSHIFFSSKICSFLCFLLLIELLVCSCIFYIILIVYLFFCSSLTICICRTVVLSSYLGNFWICFFGLVTGDVLYSFGGEIPLDSSNHCVLLLCLHIWRSSTSSRLYRLIPIREFFHLW